MKKGKSVSLFLDFADYHMKGILNMGEKLPFEVIYEAYQLCLKNKKNKFGTYNFTNYVKI